MSVPLDFLCDIKNTGRFYLYKQGQAGSVKEKKFLCIRKFYLSGSLKILRQRLNCSKYD